MSGEILDALAEMARNRGLKLVRSRVRTPGKRRFGKVGLTDASGKPVFGMDGKGPIGKPEEAEHFLRNLGARDWGASLDVAVMPRKKPAPSRIEGKQAEPSREAANDPQPARRTPRPSPPPSPPPPPPKPAPKPKLRDARPGDAEAIAALVALLDHKVAAKGVKKRIAQLAREKLTPIVATLDKKVVGLIGIDRMTAIHRDLAVGRINILVVAGEARKQGIARMLVAEAEARLARLGCGMVEVTSNDRLAAAHAFYRHMGYERTSIRFAKTL